MHAGVCHSGGESWFAGGDDRSSGPGRQSEQPPRPCGNCYCEQGERRLCGTGRRPMRSPGIVTASAELFSCLAALSWAGAEANARERDVPMVTGARPVQRVMPHRPLIGPDGRAAAEVENGGEVVLVP
jgi:hypothetical protein